MTMTPSNIHIGAGTLTLYPDSSPVSFESSFQEINYQSLPSWNQNY